MLPKISESAAWEKSGNGSRKHFKESMKNLGKNPIF